MTDRSGKVNSKVKQNKIIIIIMIIIIISMKTKRKKDKLQKIT